MLLLFIIIQEVLQYRLMEALRLRLVIRLQAGQFSIKEQAAHSPIQD